MTETPPRPAAGAPWTRAGEVLAVFLRLGLTSFGGPIAHLGYFRRECVERRGWLDDASYADLVALAQFLPGPASSQVGFALGLRRAGLAGGLAAFVGFTLPSVILMVMFAAVAAPLTASPLGAGVVHGLKLAAVAIVAQAVWGMASSLSRGWVRGLLGLAAAALALGVGGFAGQAAGLGLGAVVGLAALRPASGSAAPPSRTMPPSAGLICLLLFAVLLAISLYQTERVGTWSALQVFYRSGALVFGGGHVVAPLLSQGVVEPCWISPALFLQGYGAAQALPGPLFAFAAFLGAEMTTPPSGVSGALLATAAIFLPGLLLMAAALPFWSRLSASRRARAALAGVNAAVVGLLAAALYDPIFVGAVKGLADLGIAVVALALLLIARAPPLAAVAFCAIGGAVLGLV